MQGLDASVNAKVNAWLSGNYDEATKNELKKLIDQMPLLNLPTHSIKI